MRWLVILTGNPSFLGWVSVSVLKVGVMTRCLECLFGQTKLSTFKKFLLERYVFSLFNNFGTDKVSRAVGV